MNATVDLHVVMLQAQDRETINSAWKVAVSFEIVMTDYKRDKTVFHNTTPDLQDQDHNVQDQDPKTRFFVGLRPVLS